MNREHDTGTHNLRRLQRVSSPRYIKEVSFIDQFHRGISVCAANQNFLQCKQVLAITKGIKKYVPEYEYILKVLRSSGTSNGDFPLWDLKRKLS